MTVQVKICGLRTAEALDAALDSGADYFGLVFYAPLDEPEEAFTARDLVGGRDLDVSGGLPGVLGAVCLLLALYAFQVLPVSYAGLALILLGIGLMTAEAFAPSFGILGIGGLAAFVIGSVMLMDTELPAYRIAVPVIAAFALFSAALCSIALGLILRARRQAAVSGAEHLLGAQAVVERVTPEGAWVRLDGELWHARSDQPLAEHDEVTVDALDDLVQGLSEVNSRAAD